MTFKTFDEWEKWNKGIRLSHDRMTSFTAENAEVNQDAIDQLIVNEIISEVVDATNKIFNEHLKKHGISATSIRSDEIVADVRKWLYDDLKPMVEPKAKREPKTKNRTNCRCKLGIWKKLVIAEEIVDKFLDLFEEAADCVMSNQEAGYDITDEDREDIATMTRSKLRKVLGPTTTAKEETKMENFNIRLNLDGVDYDMCGPTYKFSGETNSMDELRRRVQSCSDAPEFLMKKFDIGTPVRHPSLIANRIWQNDGRHTTVEWRDGTKTTVCCEDPEKYTEWGGFCACVVKKLYGSATKAELELETAKKTTAWPKKRKQIEREKIKKMCRERHNRAVMEREEKIAAKMEEMWITNEAGHRLAKKYSEKETAVAVEEG